MIKKNLQNNISIYLLLFLIITLQVFILIYYMNIRTALNNDEIWEHGFANSYNSSCLYPDGGKKDINNYFYNHWHDGKKFFDYITVQPNETFAFNKVYKNKTEDAAPPLYSFLLHFVCSFFPNTFNPWYGQSINIILFIISLFVFFKLNLLLFNNNYLAFLALIFYGFSMGAINTYIYLRIYPLLTMFCIIITYLAIKICKEENVDTTKSLSLFVTGFLGFLSHHYFGIIFGMVSLGFLFYFIQKKNYKICIKYFLISLISFLAYYCYYPYVFKHASELHDFTGFEGIMGHLPLREIFAALTLMGNYTIGINAEKILAYLKDFVKVLLPILGYCKPIFALLIIITLAFFSLKKKKSLFFIILLEFLGSIIIISSYSILYFHQYFGRYFFVLLPFLCILLIKLIVFCLQRINIKLKIKNFVFFSLIIAFAINSHNNSAMEWCWNIPPLRNEIINQYKDKSVIYCSNADQHIHMKTLDFMYTKRVFACRDSDGFAIAKALSEISSNDINLIVIPTNRFFNNTFNFITKLGFKPRYMFTDESPLAKHLVFQLYPPQENFK